MKSLFLLWLVYQTHTVSILEKTEIYDIYETSSYFFYNFIGPNENRPYYRTMFENMNFKVPNSARKNLKKDPSPPGYVFNEDIPIEKVDEELDEYERSWFTRYLQQYYGMVKCIDYNIGKMLEKIESLGVSEDTIIVFTRYDIVADEI